MNRSFTNRVFGGVCGGIGETLRINPWILRIFMVLFTFASLGAGLLMYVMLWIALPQESLIESARSNSLSFLLFIAILIVMIGTWFAKLGNQLNTDAGQDLYYPILFMAFSLVFLLRQVVRS